MDVFAEHGIAGMVGLIVNGFFGANYIVGLDGVNTNLGYGGWVDHKWKQMYIQIAYLAAATVYSFVVSAIIAYAVDKVPGLQLRVSDEAELLGMDDDQMGEFAYDYVEVRRDYLAWTPARADVAEGEDSVPNCDRHGISQHSQMLEGREPESEMSDAEKASGSAHNGIAGDRHAAAYEKVERHE